MKIVRIPNGSFLMGSTKGDLDERPSHNVTISRDFSLGMYPVTQAQYRAVTGKSPSHFSGVDHRPVEGISWEEAKEFCERLSQIVERPAVLPTEAQWEYACRAGTTTEYHTGDGAAALKKAGWYGGNAGGQTHSVGKLAANAWGLYDMHGNVWEWCQDWYAPYTAGDQIDPAQLEKQSNKCRVLRGGAWHGGSGDCRAASRYRFAPATHYYLCGFRVVFRPD